MKDQLKNKVESLKLKAKSFSILYVEDEEDLREKMAVFLSKIFNHVETAPDGVEGFEKYLLKPYDIVITDILMPKANGLELIDNIRKINTKQEIIVISAYTDSEYLTQCIQLDVTGYIIKPLDFNLVLTVLESSVEKLSAFRENEMYKTKLETMVEKRTAEVTQLQEERLSNYDHAIHSLVKMIEARDTYTGGHSERVASYSRDIAKTMGCVNEECDLIYQAGILHDIGKIVTPDAILLKPGKLSEQEYALIKNHATAGYEILSEVPMYHKLSDIVYAHHEHYDGSGYPRFLKGDEIPLPARIMAVADAFDAMTTSRIYKKKKSVSEAIDELKKLSGIWYDPRVVENAVTILESADVTSYGTQEPDSHIDDERFAYFYKDPLTHLYNHDYFDALLQKNKDEQKNLCLHMLYLRNFTSYNRKYGWSEGDIFLKQFSDYLRSEFSDYQIFRIFGDDFVLLSKAHREIDVVQINNTPLLKKYHLYCDHRHLHTENTDISSYKDLQESS